NAGAGGGGVPGDDLGDLAVGLERDLDQGLVGRWLLAGVGRLLARRAGQEERQDHGEGSRHRFILPLAKAAVDAGKLRAWRPSIHCWGSSICRRRRGWCWWRGGRRCCWEGKAG